jgi:Zn-dependent M28 family amino/carboxypeptidase
MDIIEKSCKKMSQQIGLRIFFFDEEESGLKGSSAYATKYAVNDLVGLINLELVGIGDKFAIWPVDRHSSGTLLETFEHSANTADHLSFRRAGLSDAFTITCISDNDIEVASQYYKAVEQGLDSTFLRNILAEAPIFENYHQPGDTFEKIKDKSILMTSSVILDTVMAMGLTPSPSTTYSNSST